MAVLIGPPGAGKSTVGPLLAARLGVGFLETDREVEAVAGKPVGDIFVEEVGRQPEEANGGFRGVVVILELKGRGAAGLEVNQSGDGAFAVRGPIVNEELAAEVEAVAAVGVDT